MTAKKPSAFLNYSGNLTHTVGRLMGPTDVNWREYLLVVAAEHDPATNRTRLGLVYVTDPAKHDIHTDVHRQRWMPTAVAA
ncbi:hypothetical protein [Kribbella deserti]|uniref:Uncharacterized protein n=1 Tax=Kribbella deserti TaxID=1926257 RepID=A0ABV6QNA8_9ACTN